MSSIDQELSEVFRTPFTFARRPSPVDGDLRPGWRLPALVLMLDMASRGGKSSFPRLHLLNWALRSPMGRDALLNAIEGKEGPVSLLIRYEPGFHRAIAMAAGIGLVGYVGGKRVALRDLGRQASRVIRSAEGLLEAEQDFLQALGFGLTEKRVRELVWGGVR